MISLSVSELKPRLKNILKTSKLTTFVPGHTIMPNSLGRRYSGNTGSSNSGNNSEIERLKKELEDLKAAYVQDMANISNDMSTLSAKVEPSGTV